ncbi:ABC transporter substrate-binding protein [Natrarchaeobius oligotrophus]|uniref:Solute-binding protein family 5 domain-containing protein n=1 Tax=Natrarchaeobius chitinivorans TaxID=1679083 RepID=A0A3N6N1F2_NATCH|nr:ABC transporter substrate-binding protein [Natrarchaeobius chitinivorans]RQH02652.1 hypothetical protein EA472_04975 [Natrarchaeobius chitinivorans]
MSERTDQSGNTRRGVLKKTGAAALTVPFLAGCAEDGTGETGNGNGNGGGGFEQPDSDEIIDATWTRGMDETVDDMSWNPRSITLSPITQYDVYAGLWIWDYLEGELSGELASSWDIDGDEAWVEFYDSYWHNGDKFTTEDVAMSFDIMFWQQENAGDREEHPIEEFHIEDETSARIVFSGDHPPSWEHWVDMPWRGYGILYDNRNVSAEWYDRLDAEDPESDAFAEVFDDFTNTEDIYSPEEGDYPVGNGPFQYKEHTDTSVTFERFEDYAHADTINFAESRWEFHDDRAMAFFEGEIDESRHGVPPAPEDMHLMPDEYQLYREGNQRETDITFNIGDGVPGEDRPVYDRAIRESINYLVDREEWSAIFGEEWEVLEEPEHPIPEGTLREQPQEFQDMIRDLDLVNREHDIETAIERVNASENYYYDEDEEIVVCENGDYHVDAGEQAHVEILSRQDIRADISQLLSQWMDDFGWSVDRFPVDSATESERRENGTFDIKINTSSCETVGDHAAGPEIETYENRIHWSNPLPVPEVNDWDGEIVGWDYMEAWEEHAALPADAPMEEWGQYYVEASWAWNWLCARFFSLGRTEPGAIRNDQFAIDGDSTLNHIAWAPSHGIRSPETTIWAREE